MDRRTFTFGMLALPILGGTAAWGAGVDVAPINSYLKRLRAAEGNFVQVNANGSRQTGRFTLAKPGRIRFEYDRPKGAMVIADGKWVGVFDPKSNRNPTRYPLERTPLQILLRDDISLAEPGFVLGATRDPTGTHITVVDPRMPKEGRLVISFADNPIMLREWVVQTKSGERTAVSLTNLKPLTSVNGSLFNIELAAAEYR